MKRIENYIKYFENIDCWTRFGLFGDCTIFMNDVAALFCEAHGLQSESSFLLPALSSSCPVSLPVSLFPISHLHSNLLLFFNPL